MEKQITLKILSPDKLCFSGNILSVTVPTVQGDMVVYPNHAPFISMIAPGYVCYHQEGLEVVRIFVTQGYLDISHKDITLVLDDIIEEEDLTQDFLSQKQKSYAEKIANSVELEEADFDILVDKEAKYKQLMTSL